jgi:hypothetical protein
MYFFPIYGTGRPVSDLDLLAFRCAASPDGRLLVTALLENQGSDPIASDWFRSGDLGSVRVAAMVTSANGTREQVDARMYVPLSVAKQVEMKFTPTQALASDVVRIDVVADPDRVVPDPLRDNNVLSWRGSMRAGASPDCGTYR